jgi:hypothetical protein
MDASFFWYESAMGSLGFGPAIVPVHVRGAQKFVYQVILNFFLCCFLPPFQKV